MTFNTYRFKSLKFTHRLWKTKISGSDKCFKSKTSLPAHLAVVNQIAKLFTICLGSQKKKGIGSKRNYYRLRKTVNLLMK
jgi:hypothetical protein